MDLNKFRIKNSTKCDCGHEFTIMDAKELEKNNDYHYYGGRVEKYSKVRCPKCGKIYLLFIEAINNGYRVFDIAESKAVQVVKPLVKKVMQDAKTTTNASKNKQDAAVPVTTPKEDLIKVVDGFICNKCGRVFKSKSGLSSHQRKCL